jgi:hypothetical protein
MTYLPPENHPCNNLCALRTKSCPLPYCHIVEKYLIENGQEPNHPGPMMPDRTARKFSIPHRE